MVRLRREIEGVRRNHAVPPPPHAGHALATALILPPLDAWLLAQPPGRVLLAGSAPRHLAEQLAGAEHWVSVTDLDEVELRAWHAELRPEVAAHLTLLPRGYGDVAFGPASFDRIALFDTLASYRNPAWVLNKVARELKPDGLLALREVVSGALPSEWSTPPLVQAPPVAPRVGAERWLAPVLQPALPALHSRAAPWLVDGPTQEALDRGAHLHALRFALPATEVHEGVAAHLALEQVWLGSAERLMLCGLLAGARPWLAKLLQRALQMVPAAVAGEAAGGDRPRCIGLVARRKLTGGLQFR
ncbi:MAG: methyltransferase domain-containing protein [Deltaproteobacteria bacterium]|nr:methyltransferase domain-containing protein [Deltaproteobacteria bacterium]